MHDKLLPLGIQIRTYHIPPFKFYICIYLGILSERLFVYYVGSKKIVRGLPYWSSDSELPCNAGDKDSILSWGTQILHAREQLSLQTTTGEATLQSRESACHHEGPHMMQQRPHVPPLRPEAAK